MNPEQVLEKYRDLVAVNSERIALELSLNLRKESIEAQRAAFGGSRELGFFYLYRHDAHNDKVLESVLAMTGDAITSVYVNHRANASIGSLMAARSELMRAISEKIGLSIEAIGIEDPGRGRQVALSELATGQLIDILAERMGTSVAVTGSFGGDAVLQGVPA